MSIYSWTKSARLKETTNGINSAISELRSTTLSKNGRYRLWIYKKAADNTNYAVIQKYNSVTSNWEEYSTEKIGSKPSIYCVDAAGNDLVLENKAFGNQVYIEFNKSDGSFSTANCFSASGSNVNIDEINVSFGGNNKTIKLVLLTGKHYIE